MDPEYDIFEIVKVIPNFQLFDAECYQRSYSTNHGKPLTPGFYIVSWPEMFQAKRFDEYAAFHGPYKSRQEAQAFLDAIYKHKYLLTQQPMEWPSSFPNADSVAEMKVA